MAKEVENDYETKRARIIVRQHEELAGLDQDLEKALAENRKMMEKIFREAEKKREFENCWGNIDGAIMDDEDTQVGIGSQFLQLWRTFRVTPTF